MKLFIINELFLKDLLMSPHQKAFPTKNATQT